MAGTYSQIYIQVVFAVQGRQNLLQKEWRQEGYGAFSYSHSQIESVYNYILNQETHHAKQSFKDEYMDFLKKFEIEHDEKYLFEWIQ
jgi:hypothetical protein